MNDKDKYLEAIKKRALGYEYEEVQNLIEETKGGTKKKIIITKKQVPPDVEAAKYLLKLEKSKSITISDMEKELRGVIESGNKEDKN